MECKFLFFSGRQFNGGWVLGLSLGVFFVIYFQVCITYFPLYSFNLVFAILGAMVFVGSTTFFWVVEFCFLDG